MRCRGVLVALSSALVACSVGKAPPAEPRTEDEKAIYALGFGLSSQVAPLHLTEGEIRILAAGLADGALGRTPKAEPAAYREKIQRLANERSAAAAADEKKTGTAFLENIAREEGVSRIATGLLFKPLSEGSGSRPVLGDTVRVRYTGRLIDGTVFDSTSAESEPALVPLGQAIQCWQQGLQLMKEGGKAQLYCPSDLAYGDRGLPPRIAPGATLIFEVELVSVVK